jgi:hypothetical protein
MVGTRGPVSTAEDNSTQGGQNRGKAHTYACETCGARRSDKGRPARLKLRAQALWYRGSVALNPQSDRELRSVCRFGPAVSALETVSGNDRPTICQDQNASPCLSWLDYGNIF